MSESLDGSLRRLNVDGIARAIAATPPDEHDVLRWEDEGVEREAVVHRIGANEWHLRLGKRSLRLWAARTDEGTWVSWAGHTRLVRDATREARRSAGGPGTASDVVTPPTPATVVNVLVALGDEVEAGAALVVVSAMKMETTLTAPHAGVVSAVDTEPGARVSPGDVLVEIEKSDDD